ncbi:MAG TPA: hypothetical protein VK172_02295 [Lentimicrobium sp.]|nr:hypothetical protein [Lentimicrobium sp.]
MNPEDFQELPVERRVNLVLSEGHELLDRIYMFYVIKLYAFRGLFIEIWYQQISNRIEKLQLVEMEDVLHLYESQINISDLFK